MSISDYLFRCYQIRVTSGTKSICHICHSKNKTLSIRKDDTLAKCFRCGHYLLVMNDGNIFESNKQEKK